MTDPTDSVPALNVAPAPSAGTATVDEFVVRFAPSSDTSLISVAEVEDECHEAAAAFPLELPDGYTWPSGPSRSYGNASQWECGTGVAETYSYWEAAQVTAAFADWSAGDEDAASEHLEALVSGYASPVPSLYVDPEHPGTDSEYHRTVIEPAMRGYFSPIAGARVESFVRNDEYRAIAALAGDRQALPTHFSPLL